MAYLQSGLAWDGNRTSSTLTVPAGVTEDQTVLIQITGSVIGPSTVVATSGSAVFTELLAPTVYENAFVSLLKGTGLLAGSTITIAYDKTTLALVSHHYFDTDFGSLGVPGTPATNSASVVAPSIATTAGQKVTVIGCNRNGDGTMMPASVNSNGYAVANLNYEYSVTAGVFAQNYIAEFTSANSESGDSTITFSDTVPRRNLMAVMIPELDITPPDTTGYITAGQAIKNSGGHTSYKLTVPAGITTADSCFFTLSGYSNNSVNMSATTTAGVLTQVISPITVGTNSLGAWVGTSMQEGDEITLSSTSGNSYTAEHWYFKGALSIGTVWQSPSSVTVGQAPSMSVGAEDKLYAFNYFRSNPNVAPYIVTNANSYASTELYTSFDNVGYGNTGVFAIDAAAGQSGITSISMQNTSAKKNGFAFHLLESADATPTPIVTVSWLNGMETTTVRAGWIVRNITSLCMVVSEQLDLSSPVYSSTVTVPGNGWVKAAVSGLNKGTQYYIGIEADGVVIADGRLQGRTFDDSGPLSYVALTGSCQNTGSNPIVFQQMEADNAVFFSHQGDLHYSDTAVESTWRNGFIASMKSPNFASFISKLQMQYCYDNHDWAGQGSEADTWSAITNPATMVRELTGGLPGSAEIYNTWVHGRVRYIHLDQWSQRDDDAAPETEDKRFITDEQEQWLYATLESAKEPLIVLLSNWPMYHNLRGGRWASYPNQTARIKAWIESHPSVLNRMICVGGDSHSVCADTGANQDALGYIPTLNASPLAQAGGLAGGVWDISNIDVDSLRGYYSRMTITDDGHKLVFKWDAVQDDGEIMSTYTRTVGTPTVWDGVSELPTTVSVWDGSREATGFVDI